MRHVSLILIGSLLAACARIPPVTIHYPLARSALHVEIVQTLGCDASNMPVVVNTVTPTMLHMADTRPGAKMGSIDLSRIDGPLSNSELKTDFYADGRLKAINATTTGQGEAILKTAIELLSMAGEAPPQVDPKPICEKFRKAFADKTLTLTYELTHALEPGDELTEIKPEHASKAQYDRFKDLLGMFCLQVPRARPATKPATATPGSGDVTVIARQPALVEAAVTVGSLADCAETVLWSGVVPAGQHGAEYAIPVPRAAFFGKQVFAASFEESGAMSSLQYNKETGAGQMLNVVQAGAKQIQTTDEERAAKLKAKADLIVAQQRMVRCQVNPSTCT